MTCEPQPQKKERKKRILKHRIIEKGGNWNLPQKKKQ